MLLEGFRSHKRWLMVIAMVFIIPSFVVTGIYSYNRMMDDSNDIAEVDGNAITQQQFDDQKRKALDNLRAQMGDQFKANVLDNQTAKAAILENIINERSLSNEALNAGISIPQATAVNTIKSSSGFQEKGKFSAELYENYLRSLGYSDEYFVELVREDIARQLLQNSVGGTTLVPDSVLHSVHRLLAQVRTASLMTINAADYLAKVTVSENEARDYWQKHQEDFRLPDMATVQYVVFSPDLFKNVKPSEDDLETFYKQNPTRFHAPEERRASHILIDLSDGDAKAKETAQKIFEQVKADPTKFADLAKQYSKDPGSAASGGDLGWFTKGMMVPAFDQAVFSAKKGEIVGPVKTEFGYHIIYITDVRGNQEKPFAEVKEEIIRLYQEQKSQELFGKEAEIFTNMVYEQSDSLDGVAQKYGMKIETLTNVTAQGPKDPALAKILNSSVMEALFSEEGLREKRNTQAIEVSSNVLVSARVQSFRAAHIRSFDDARADIEKLLKNQKALDLASQEGVKRLTLLQSGKTSEGTFGAEEQFTRSVPGSHSQQLVNAIENVSADKLPVYVGVREDNAYVIARVVKSTYTEPTKEQLTGLRNELDQMYSRVDQEVYYSALRAKHKAKVLNSSFLPQAGGPAKSE